MLKKPIHGFFNYGSAERGRKDRDRKKKARYGTPYRAFNSYI